jgi:hypothetical protein
MIAAFSAATWFPQNILAFLPSLWKAFHNLGRKNYLFAGSHDAVQRAAMMYSLLGTYKMNGINPWQRLNHVLTVIPDWKANRLVELLPINFPQFKVLFQPLIRIINFFIPSWPKGYLY